MVSLKCGNPLIRRHQGSIASISNRLIDTGECRAHRHVSTVSPGASGIHAYPVLRSKVEPLDTRRE